MIQNRRSTTVSPQQLEMIHQAIFGQYDLDHNGFLEQEEVKIFMRDALMAGGHTQEEAEIATKKFYHAVDKNGDGKISKDELIEILKYILEHKISEASRAARKL